MKIALDAEQVQCYNLPYKVKYIVLGESLMLLNEESALLTEIEQEIASFFNLTKVCVGCYANSEEDEYELDVLAEDILSLINERLNQA